MKISDTFRPLMTLGPSLMSAVLSASCATAPVALTAARAEYGQASTGPAARYAPTELHKAKLALDKAEESFSDFRDPQMTVDLSNAAESLTQNAEAVAARAAEKKDSDASQQEADRRADASERRVLAANREAQEANDEVARRAAKVEERGTVITMSESALFATNDATLLPAAQSRLNHVAYALVAKGRAVVVEGYTDSSGSQTSNLDLSQRRAESVRTYLVSRGVPGAMISARGLGPDRPVAESTSAEGRANNRRIEIVFVKDEPRSN